MLHLIIHGKFTLPPGDCAHDFRHTIGHYNDIKIGGFYI